MTLLQRLSLAALPGWTSIPAYATETATISPAGSAVQVIFGLIAVLGVMMLIAWIFKRYAPGVSQSNSVARIIGGVSVGSRERVVVIEVADRWLVVGVAPGQVNSIANLEAGELAVEAGHPGMVNNPFAKWLTSAMHKTQPASKPESH